MRIDVAATLTLSSPAPATALLQIAVPAPQSELLTVLTDGRAAGIIEIGVDGARAHRFELSPGTTTVGYNASVESTSAPRAVTPAD